MADGAARRGDPRIQAKAASLRARYLRRAAPHLVAEFGCDDGDMRALRRSGLQRVAELRKSRFLARSEGAGQKRVDRLRSEYAEASTQQLQQQHSGTPRADDYVEVEVPAGWSTLMYANVEGSVVEVSIDEVGALLETGEIAEETYVIVEGMPSWATFADFVAMYHLEDELLSSRRASPATLDTRAHFRDEMVSEALGTRPPLLSSASLQSVSHMEELKERRRSLLREASEMTVTMLSPRSRTTSAEDSPRTPPLSAPRHTHQMALSPIPGSAGSAAPAALAASSRKQL